MAALDQRDIVVHLYELSKDTVVERGRRDVESAVTAITVLLRDSVEVLDAQIGGSEERRTAAVDRRPYDATRSELTSFAHSTVRLAERRRLGEVVDAAAD
jgi:hypothetical protein